MKKICIEFSVDELNYEHDIFINIIEEDRLAKAKNKGKVTR